MVRQQFVYYTLYNPLGPPAPGGAPPDALPFGRLWYLEVRRAIDFASIKVAHMML